MTRYVSLAQCQDGWYFDDNASPSVVHLCPDTCTALRARPAARVDVTLGCATLLTPSLYRQVYDGQCPIGGQVQWSFLAYDTSTPADSSIRFRARSADTQAELSAAPFADLATARAATNTQQCALSGPAPCPIDLYENLGAARAKLRYLELEAAVTPSTDQRSTPTLNAWQITYSCPPGE